MSDKSSRYMLVAMLASMLSLTSLFALPFLDGINQGFFAVVSMIGFVVCSGFFIAYLVSSFQEDVELEKKRQVVREIGERLSKRVVDPNDIPEFYEFSSEGEIIPLKRKNDEQ